MRALCFGSPSAMAAPVGAPRGITATPERKKAEKAELAKPASDRLMDMTRLTATKPELRTPSRFPVDSNGQRLCSTPKFGRASVSVRNQATQTPKTIRASSVMRNHSSPTPKKLKLSNGAQASPTSKKIQVAGGVENQTPSSQEDSVNADNQPLETFTVYVNPSFEPVEPMESPVKENQLPSCIPVDSNGQKLCRTPKRTQSPGPFKLRVPKGNSSQRLETIHSPLVRNDQVKSVLGDSNGQYAQGTPTLSKRFTTPRERSAALGTNGSENLTPRALFSDSHGAVTPRSNSRILRGTTREPTPAGVAGTRCSPAVQKAVGSTMKKRGRSEDDVSDEDENARITRSRTQAERIAIFLRSPAARVRPDGRKEEFWLGVSDDLLEKYTENKLLSASKAGVQR